MLYHFNVVPSLGQVTPCQSYFDSVTKAAQRALSAIELDITGVTALCELVDTVDSQAMPLDKGLYARSVAVLSYFLQVHRNTADVKQLASKSWAAQTLLELTSNYEHLCVA